MIVLDKIDKAKQELAHHCKIKSDSLPLAMEPNRAINLDRQINIMTIHTYMVRHCHAGRWMRTAKATTTSRTLDWSG